MHRPADRIMLAHSWFDEMVMVALAHVRKIYHRPETSEMCEISSAAEPPNTQARMGAALDHPAGGDDVLLGFGAVDRA